MSGTAQISEDHGSLQETEETALSDIFLEATMRLGSRDFGKTPDIIWHYTSASALLSIIEQKSIYMTETSCLNDATEIAYFFKLFEQTLGASKIISSSPDTSPLRYAFDAMADGLAFPGFGEDEWAVTCFSAVRDDLSQWRAYGGGENGFALGFSTPQFLELSDAKLIRVNYDVNDHLGTCSRLITDCATLFAEGWKTRNDEKRKKFTSSFSRSFFTNAFHLAPVIKDGAFSAEEELRIIRRHSTSSQQKCVFLPRSTFISRHYPLQFPSKRDIFAGIPLAKILVGPSRFQTNSMRSVERMLKQNGLVAVEVIPSRIPFRST